MKTQRKTLEVSYTSIVILRVMLSLIFIVASLSHLINTTAAVSRIKNSSMAFIGHLLGPPKVSVIVSGIVMLIGGLALLVGYKAKYAALMLIAILIPITLTIQVGQMSSIGPLFKNISIFGGLLFFAINKSLKPF
ncbi:DoxX family protein [Mariniflexile ostreae]|uniref:DoxX family protein n=1 Tax=Mariniflexile ostreae TaxID=1520892 RepID=A0ABV5F9U5_9FLAO